MRRFWAGRTWVFMALLVSVAFIGCAKEKPVPEVDEEAVRLEQERLRQEEAERARRAREAEEQRLREAAETAARNEFGAQMAVRIHFDFDRSDLRSDDREILSRKASLLRERPSVTIRIAGHCDEWGTEEYNLALGERRAQAAKAYLVNAGIDASRISTISYGKEMPLDSGHDRDAWSNNRRGEFEIVSW